MSIRSHHPARHRRTPNLESLETRNLLSAGIHGHHAHVARPAGAASLVAIYGTDTETTTGRITSSDGVTTISANGSGSASLLGSFTESISVQRVPAASGSSGYVYIGGTITYTTPKGQLNSGAIVGQASLYIDPATGDEHLVSTIYASITGGTGKFAGATGVIVKEINADLVTSNVQAVDYGYISLHK